MSWNVYKVKKKTLFMFLDAEKVFDNLFGTSSKKILQYLDCGHFELDIGNLNNIKDKDFNY